MHVEQINYLQPLERRFFLFMVMLRQHASLHCSSFIIMHCLLLLKFNEDKKENEREKKSLDEIIRVVIYTQTLSCIKKSSVLRKEMKILYYPLFIFIITSSDFFGTSLNPQYAKKKEKKSNFANFL